MHSFHDLEITTLKKICSKYNLHVKIAKYSKLSKTELIPHMEKHLMITQDGKIKMKKECVDSVEDELSKIINDLKNKVKEVKEKVQKQKAMPKEEEKNINIEKKVDVKPKKVMKALTVKQVKEEAKKCDLQVTKKINGKVKPKTKKELLNEISKCKEKKEEPKQKKTYDNYSQYNEDEKEFMNAVRGNNGLNRPDKLQKIYNEKFSNKNIEDFYIYRMEQARAESLENLENQIKDKHSELHLENEIYQLNQKINSNNTFKTKKAQKKADARVEEWRNELYPKERELKKYNKIRNIQKENYEKLKNMKIESVEDANKYADLIKASNYMNLTYSLDIEEKKKDKEHQEFIDQLGKKEMPKEEKPMSKNQARKKEREEIGNARKAYADSLMKEEKPMNKIDKIENELQKLEQLIKMDEKENEKEHKEMKKEIKQKKEFTVEPLTGSKAEMTKQYKKQALKFHPDKNVGNEEEAKKAFQILTNMYQKLMGEDGKNVVEEEEDKFNSQASFTNVKIMSFIKKYNTVEKRKQNLNGYIEYIKQNKKYTADDKKNLLKRIEMFKKDEEYLKYIGSQSSKKLSNDDLNKALNEWYQLKFIGNSKKDVMEWCEKYSICENKSYQEIQNIFKL